MDPILMQLFLEDGDDGEFDKLLENTSLPKSLINTDDDLIYKQIQTVCFNVAYEIEDLASQNLSLNSLNDNFNHNSVMAISNERAGRRIKKLKLQDIKKYKTYIDSDVDDEEIQRLIRARKKKKLGIPYRVPESREKLMELRMANPFEDKSDFEFFRYIRVTRNTFSYLFNKIKDSGLFFQTFSGGNFPVQAEQALQMFLYYMGQKCTYKVLSQMYHVSESAIMTSFMKCVDGINRLDDKEVKWPSETEDAKTVESDFRSVAGLPGVVGSLGGCCIEMRTNKEPPAGYKIGKLRSIMHLLAVTDAYCRFMYIQAGFPGTFSLQEAYESSSLGEMMKVSSSSLFANDDSYLIGDSNFVLNQNLMVPYTDVEPDNNAQLMFNDKLEHSNTSKRTFDLLKNRFATFQDQIYGNLEKIPNIIKACCIIHNIAIRDPDDHSFLLKYQRNISEDYSEYRDESDFISVQPHMEAYAKRNRITSQVCNS